MTVDELTRQVSAYTLEAFYQLAVSMQLQRSLPKLAALPTDVSIIHNAVRGLCAQIIADDRAKLNDDEMTLLSQFLAGVVNDYIDASEGLFNRGNL